MTETAPRVPPLTVDVEGKRYRLSFRHHTPTHDTGRRDRRDRPILEPTLFEVHNNRDKTTGQLVDQPWLRSTVARALSWCAVTVEHPVMEKRLLIDAPAICSASDAFSYEFARQAALARVLFRLDVSLAGPLLGAYMASGKRTLLDLSHVRLDENGRVFSNLRELVEWLRVTGAPVQTTHEVVTHA